MEPHRIIDFSRQSQSYMVAKPVTNSSSSVTSLLDWPKWSDFPSRRWQYRNLLFARDNHLSQDYMISLVTGIVKDYFTITLHSPDGRQCAMDVQWQLKNVGIPTNDPTLQFIASYPEFDATLCTPNLHLIYSVTHVLTPDKTGISHWVTM